MERQILPATRFDKSIAVYIKTFGSDYVYDTVTLNISKSGFLTASPASLPFQVNTLVELTIDPDSSTFSEPLSCIGTVTRIAGERKSERRDYQSIVGISISDYDDFEVDSWKVFVEVLEVDDLDKQQA